MSSHSNPATATGGHVCSDCNKTYTLAKHLRRHLQTSTAHSSVKKYRCPVAGCGKDYTRSDELHRHIKGIHLPPGQPARGNNHAVTMSGLGDLTGPGTEPAGQSSTGLDVPGNHSGVADEQNVQHTDNTEREPPQHDNGAEGNSAAVDDMSESEYSPPYHSSATLVGDERYHGESDAASEATAEYHQLLEEEVASLKDELRQREERIDLLEEMVAEGQRERARDAERMRELERRSERREGELVAEIKRLRWVGCQDGHDASSTPSRAG